MTGYELREDSKAKETVKLFAEYSQKRTPWEERVIFDKNFRYGNQWSTTEIKALKQKGHAPVVINCIHPAVEAVKAMITANKPAFRVSPREDSDNQVAQAINGLIQYTWQVSAGNSVIKQMVDEYCVAGLGYLMAYFDPFCDMGKGDVKFKDLDPIYVFVDPMSRDKLFDDAANIIVSMVSSKKALCSQYPELKAKIMAASSDMNYYPQEMFSQGDIDNAGSTSTNMSGVFFPSLQDQNQGEDYIRWYDRYSRVIEPEYRYFEKFSGRENTLNKEKIREYLQQPAWVVNGKIMTDPVKVQQTIQMMQQQAEQIMQQYQQQVQQQYQQLVQAGQIMPGADPKVLIQSGMIPPPPEIPQPQVQQTSFFLLAQQDLITIVETRVYRIRNMFVAGNVTLYDRIMPLQHYPIIPCANLHTRTPYPLSDVHMVVSQQEEINKTRSLIIANASSGTTNKLIINRGSANIVELEQKWAKPNAIIEVDFDNDKPPVVVAPAPIPAELYQKEMTAKNDIDRQLGIYDLMMGNTANLPNTYKATVSVDEFGQRKIKSKLEDVENTLARLGTILIAFYQNYYTTEKMFRIIQPNNSQTEFAINKRLYDDYGAIKGVLNDIGTGLYDVIVVPGSTLPSNRYAQLEIYMDAYVKGIIDRVEVLKKTEVFDMEGVLQRVDDIQQLTQQLQQANKMIEDLQGDLQTREREVYHAKTQTAVEKFKGQLNQSGAKLDAAKAITMARLGDIEKNSQMEANYGVQSVIDKAKLMLGSPKTAA
jgi:hypothetical protein